VVLAGDHGEIRCLEPARRRCAARRSGTRVAGALLVDLHSQDVGDKLPARPPMLPAVLGASCRAASAASGANGRSGRAIAATSNAFYAAGRLGANCRSFRGLRRCQEVGAELPPLPGCMGTMVYVMNATGENESSTV
jgi:hypothetical protein